MYMMAWPMAHARTVVHTSTGRETACLGKKAPHLLWRAVAQLTNVIPDVAMLCTSGHATLERRCDDCRHMTDAQDARGWELQV